MYIKEPIESIIHIAEISDKLFIQDLKYRKRSKFPPHFGEDGDTTRYSTENSGSLNQSPFNLAEAFNVDVMRFQLEFTGECNKFHTEVNPPIHILAMIELNSRINYSEFRETYSKFSILRLRIIHALKVVKSRLLCTKSILS